MKEIEELAGNIKDAKLRQNVISALKSPGKLSNKGFKYPASKFKEAPASLNWHHAKLGGLLEHTVAVTRMCIAVAESLKKTYGAEIDTDSLVAAALLHDFGKLFEMRKEKEGWNGTGVALDHTMLGTSELYSRGFPEKVIHIIASHFGENGPTPPGCVEAVIMHTVDNFDANVSGSQDTAQNQILKMLGLG